MLRSLRSFVDSQEVMAFALAAFLIFCGFGLAAKADTKWGYVIAAGGILLVLFTLRVNGLI